MRRVVLLLVVLAFSVPVGDRVCQAQTQMTAAQRKELGELSDKLTEVARHLRNKDYPAARSQLDDVENRLKAVSSQPQVAAGDPVLTRLGNVITRHRATLDKGMAAAGNGEAAGKPAAAEQPSFVDHVAPLVNSRCLGCHGATNPRNGLQLDTFAGWRKGGRGGQLLVAGNASRSLLMARLSTTDQTARMPQQGEPCTAEEIAAIAKWINAGAKFDGNSEAASLASVIEQREEAKLNITIPKSKGTEQVKFTRDIAPWFVNLCLNCHSANRKSGGLSLETYYDMMKGGESGPVIIPGDMENSRLFRLVGGLELPRMPASDARITRKNYEDLRTWFREGNTFDGENPRANLRSFARAEPEAAANRFTSMTDQQFREYRLARSQEQLRKAVPNDDRQVLEREAFLLLGNVPQARLEEVSQMLKQQLATVRGKFDGPEQPWRGRLAVFVLKDRFSFDEFSETVLARRPEAASRALVRVSENHEDALLALLDQPTSSGGLEFPGLAMWHLTSAYLQRSGTGIPLWLRDGVGLTLAEGAVSQKPFFTELEKTAKLVAPTVSSPDEIFTDRAFSPESNAAVGYALVKFLSGTGSAKQLSQFLGELQSGRSLDEALQSVYRINRAQLAGNFLASLKRGG